VLVTDTVLSLALVILLHCKILIVVSCKLEILSTHERNFMLRSV